MGIFDRIADQLGDLIAPDDVRVHVELGEALLSRGEIDTAIRELERAVAIRPDHARAVLLLSAALVRKGEPARAEQYLQQLVGERPDLAEGQLALGDILVARGDLDGALDAFRRGLEATGDGPARGEVYRRLGDVQFRAGSYDKAVRELRKAAAALPGDIGVHALLGRALLMRARQGAGDFDAARLVLERATAGGEPPFEALAALGEVYSRLGRSADAAAVFRRLVERDPASLAGWLGLSELARTTGDRAAARAHAETATRLARTADTVRAFADALDDPHEALAAFEEAASLSAPEQLRPITDHALARALRTVARSPDEQAFLDERAGHYAEIVLSLAGVDASALLGREARLGPGLVRAASALAAGRLVAGKLDEAEQLARLALATEDTLDGRLVQARVALARADRVQAAAALRRAVELSPEGDVRARQRLAEVYRAPAEEAPPSDLYGLLRAAHRQLLLAPETSDLAPEASRVVEILDRPLLVTVMGEFNAGKSTFVNAFVGEEVAPMGIVPTTATINVLKYGAERGGRVVYRDDTVKTVPWEQVGPLLRALDEDEARRIRFVEVLYPLDTLLRVNVVDTPGLNSIRPEHEATAREFVAQADAVIWLFSFRQPGTASEREALERVHDQHKKALGVVNQLDLVADEADRQAVLVHLEKSFGDLVEAIVPLSAREALLGRHDPARLERSNRAALDQVLEERFFSRAKAIQREAARHRLGALLDEARHRGEAAVASGQRERLEAARARTEAEAARFRTRLAGEERLGLLAVLDDLYAQAAREVLDFVRPRRWAFGANEAAPADRDFLVGLVEQQLGELTDSSRQRIADDARRLALGLHDVDPDLAETLVGDQLRLLDEQVYGRYRAFARGFLRGGRVDDFFTRVLPKLELGEHAIRRALLRDMPALDVLDAELLVPLSAWSEQLLEALRARLWRLIAADEVRRFEIETRLIAPLTALADCLARIAADTGKPPDGG